MDPKTGHIVPIPPDKTAKEMGLIPLDKMPDRNCKMCWGKGYMGFDVKTQEYLPCPCTKKKKT
jgi:hypothetical protein